MSRVAALLAVLSSSQNPPVLFNPAVLRKGFNLLIYLWCNLALLVGSRQEVWNKYHSLVPLKIWNCSEPIIFGKMQSLSMKAGTLEENATLTSCVLFWLKEEDARSNMARFSDLTHASQISQARRRIKRPLQARKVLLLMKVSKCCCRTHILQ